MFKKIENFALQHNLLTANTTIIIGLSGGPDSVFLLHFLHSIKEKYNLSLIAAHLNHGWRQESTQDEQFCKELATSLAIPFISAHAQDIVVTRKQTRSQEDLGRQLRRQFFTHSAQEHGAHAIALAHHRDDQIETFFIRLLRGAGITGLSSIRAQHDNYIRPLLCISKQEILEYLHAHQIAYCTDVTNEHDTYLRNRIRKYLIPAAHACDARAPKTVVNTIEQLQKADDFLENLTQETYTRIAPHNELSCTQLAQLHPYLQTRILLQWLRAYQVPFTPTESFYHEVLRFLLHGKSQHHTIAHWSIIKKDNKATIAL